MKKKFSLNRKGKVIVALSTIIVATSAIFGSLGVSYYINKENILINQNKSIYLTDKYSLYTELNNVLRFDEQNTPGRISLIVKDGTLDILYWRFLEYKLETSVSRDVTGLSQGLYMWMQHDREIVKREATEEDIKRQMTSWNEIHINYDSNSIKEMHQFIEDESYYHKKWDNSHSYISNINEVFIKAKGLSEWMFNQKELYDNWSDLQEISITSIDSNSNFFSNRLILLTREWKFKFKDGKEYVWTMDSNIKYSVLDAQ